MLNVQKSLPFLLLPCCGFLVQTVELFGSPGGKEPPPGSAWVARVPARRKDRGATGGEHPAAALVLPLERVDTLVQRTECGCLNILTEIFLLEVLLKISVRCHLVVFTVLSRHWYLKTKCNCLCI